MTEVLEVFHLYSNVDRNTKKRGKNTCLVTTIQNVKWETILRMYKVFQADVYKNVLSTCPIEYNTELHQNSIQIVTKLYT